MTSLPTFLHSVCRYFGSSYFQRCTVDHVDCKALQTLLQSMGKTRDPGIETSCRRFLSTPELWVQSHHLSRAYASYLPTFSAFSLQVCTHNRASQSLSSAFPLPHMPLPVSRLCAPRCPSALSTALQTNSRWISEAPWDMPQG